MNETPPSGPITQNLDNQPKEAHKLDTYVSAMKRTWNHIEEDMLQLGSLTRRQAAEQTADYVYMYGHDDAAEAKRLGKEICALPDGQFKEMTKLAFPYPRYSA